MSILHFTDIDGTVYDEGYPGEERGYRDAVAQLRKIGYDVRVVYVSGRGIDDIRSLLARSGLPEPEAVISSTGTDVTSAGDTRFPFWQNHLDWEKAHGWDAQRASDIMVRISETFRQPDQVYRREHLAEFKLSYHLRHAPREQIDEIRRGLHQHGVPATVIYSCGFYLDILPAHCNKGTAIDLYCRHAAELTSNDMVVFSGDSANDLHGFWSRSVSHRLLIGNRPELVETLKESKAYEGCRHVSDGPGPGVTGPALVRLVRERYET